MNIYVCIYNKYFKILTVKTHVCQLLNDSCRRYAFVISWECKGIWFDKMMMFEQNFILPAALDSKCLGKNQLDDMILLVSLRYTIESQ